MFRTRRHFIWTGYESIWNTINRKAHYHILFLLANCYWQVITLIKRLFLYFFLGLVPNDMELWKADKCVNVKFQMKVSFWNDLHVFQQNIFIMVFNATFNTISVISCGQFYWRRTRRKQPICRKSLITFSHDVVHLAPIVIRTHNISGDRHWLHR